jgi:hypothetical protein
VVGRGFDQVPKIAVKVGEHRDAAIGLVGGRADPFDAGGGEAGVVAGEVVGVKEEDDTAAGLIADRGLLLGGGALGEEDGGGVRGCAGRADDDPALVLLGLRRVLDQGEAELAYVEGERLVIVADEDSDMG